MEQEININKRCCKNCEFYVKEKCEDFDGEYFLCIMSESDICPDFLQKRDKGYSLREIVNHLEKD